MRMGTSGQPDRSLGSGISLPQWMKGKIDNRFDFDEAAFSPPSYDDSFFYIRYPKSQNSEAPQQELKRIATEVYNENNITSASNQITSENSISNLKEVKEIDFSKHPLPCQPFIPIVNNKAGSFASQKTSSGNVKPKSQGTDDGFHGEPALCGKSIVHVASQMMSGKFTKVFTSDSHSQQPTESSLKNVSRSLPASPLTSPTATPDNSPKARRKIANRYFTGAFVPDKEKYQGNWILASILGQSREIIAAQKIEEEDEPLEPRKPLSRKKSISSQNLTYIGKEEKSANKSSVYANVLEAKPSELREMNFWSPTSM